MVKYNTMYRVAFVQLSSSSVYCRVTVVLLSCDCRVPGYSSVIVQKVQVMPIRAVIVAYRVVCDAGFRV